MSADLEWEVLEYLESLPDDPFEIALELWRHRDFGLPGDIIDQPICRALKRVVKGDDRFDRAFLHPVGYRSYRVDVKRYPSQPEREKAAVTLPDKVIRFQDLFEKGRFPFLIEGPRGDIARFWLRVFHPFATQSRD